MTTTSTAPKSNRLLDGLAHWLPLVLFTVSPGGRLPVGESVQARPPTVIFIGNNRRDVRAWQRALSIAQVEVRLVVVDTGGRTLASAVADDAVTVDALTAPVAQIAATRETDRPPVALFPISPNSVSLLDQLEPLTGASCRLLPTHPPTAAEMLLTGHPPDPGAALAANLRDRVPLAFNLALFMSLATLFISLALGSRQGWLWFLLPWPVCLGSAFLRTVRPRMPGLALGLLWGFVLGLPLVGWQASVGDWVGGIRWVAAVGVMGGWAGWRLVFAVQ